MDDSKKIIFVETKVKKVVLEKPKKKRMVTLSKNWALAIEELENLETTNVENMIETEENKLQKVLLKQIKSKISGYAGQDKDKKIILSRKICDIKQRNRINEVVKYDLLLLQRRNAINV